MVFGSGSKVRAGRVLWPVAFTGCVPCGLSTGDVHGISGVGVLGTN
jgi:hypothetical protein